MILCPRCNSSRISESSSSRLKYECEMCKHKFNLYDTGAIKFEPIDDLTRLIYEEMEKRKKG